MTAGPGKLAEPRRQAPAAAAPRSALALRSDDLASASHRRPASRGRDPQPANRPLAPAPGEPAAARPAAAAPARAAGPMPPPAAPACTRSRHGGWRGRSGSSSPRASRSARRPGSPKRSAIASAGSARELAQRPHPEPLEGVGDPRAGPLVAEAGRAAPPPASSSSSRRAGAPGDRDRRPAGAHPSRRRPRAEPAWPGTDPAPACRERPSGPGQHLLDLAAKPAQRRRRRSTPRRVARARPAAPIDSSRAQRALPDLPRRAPDPGATRVRAGQRESASPRRIPARTPNASAAPDASPITCGPPGSGARATGRPRSSERRSPKRARQR